MEYLKRKLGEKRSRVLLRYRYYDMKNSIQNFSKLMPPDYQWMSETIGWCGKAVDALAARLQFNRFREDNFRLNDIYALNNADILFDSAILGALIASCSFVYISADEDGQPRLQVIDGSNATGIADTTTGMLSEGYAVLQRDTDERPVLEAYFLPHSVTIYERGAEAYTVEHAAPYPLLVPVVYRPDATRPFGHSRITRACMSTTQSALRTILRSEVAAEFYSFPQRYILGLDDNAEFNGKASTVKSFLSFGRDQDNNLPQVGQFPQASMQPHIEQFRMFAAKFAGETSLTLDDLGIAQDNPSSNEAIEASHEMLRLTAQQAQRSFGVGFLNAGYLAACLRDDFPYQRRELYQTHPAWRPIFTPSHSQIAAVGDAVYKLNEARPGYITDEKLEDMLGF